MSTSQAADFDFVIPLFRFRWNTRATLEGLTKHYDPQTIHIVAPAQTVQVVEQMMDNWAVAPVQLHEEDGFFERSTGLSREMICSELVLGEGSLYTPGWFYQQLLKLGAPEGIPDLTEWYMVWDSDLLPVETWPILVNDGDAIQHFFALLQSNRTGNAKIVAQWAEWIHQVLGITPLLDDEGTLVPHHMWFRQKHLTAFKQQLNQYFQSEDHWLRLMMRSANKFTTFAEYWSYSSWVGATAPNDLSYHPYALYGETTERFFDDGTARFSLELRKYLSMSEDGTTFFAPSYADVDAFIREVYGSDPLPSSLSFESSPRHLKKDPANMHIEETRSRWNPRNDF
ncbi:MAG: DUF6492 family protein [Cyanobacteria bacterium P01_H01_bin.15]